jgi:hypothetical protein
VMPNAPGPLPLACIAPLFCETCSKFTGGHTGDPAARGSAGLGVEELLYAWRRALLAVGTDCDWPAWLAPAAAAGTAGVNVARSWLASCAAKPFRNVSGVSIRLKPNVSPPKLGIANDGTFGDWLGDPLVAGDASPKVNLKGTAGCPETLAGEAKLGGRAEVVE